MLRFITVSALAVALFTQAFAGPDDDFIAVYNLIQQADNLRDSGQIGAARRAYAEAQQRLGALHRAYPEWNERVIAYRQRYVAERVAALPGTEPDAAPAAATTTNAAPVAPAELAPSGEVVNQFNTLNAQIAQLAADKKLLEAKLREALTAQPAPIDPRELKQAVEKITALQATNQVLLASLEQQQAERKNLVEKVVAEEAREALNAANRQLLTQQTAAAALAKEKAELEAQLKRLQDGEIKQLRSENTTLKSQVTELKSDTERGRQIADLTARLGKLQAKQEDTAKQNEQLLIDKAKLEKQLDDIRSRQTEESIVRVNKLETDLAVARADSARNAAKAEDIAARLQKEKTARGQLEEDNRALTARVATLSDQLAAAKALETALIAEKAERAEVEAQLKAAEQRLAAAKAAVVPSAKPEAGAPAVPDPALTAQVKVLETETARLRDALREGRSRETELRALWTEADRQRTDLQREKTELQKRLRLAEQTAAASPSGRDARTIRKLEDRVRELERQKAELSRKMTLASERSAQEIAARRWLRFVGPRDRSADLRLGR